MGFASSDRADLQKTGWNVDGSGTALSAQAESMRIAIPLPEELTAEYALLAGIATNLRSGFLLLNVTEQLIYTNPGAQRLLSIETADLASVGDVRTRLLTLAANPSVARTELDRLWLTLEERQFVDLALTDGVVRWLRVQSFPVYDNPGHLLGRGLLLDDVTLERSATQSRNETLAMAAHELKTPLAIIKGSATTLLSSAMRWDVAMQREMLQMIDTQADRLHEILNTLLEVWRLDAGKQQIRFSEIYLPELLLALVERWQKNAPNHRFVCEVARDLPTLLGEPVRLEQALQQLLHNAVICSPAGGTIKLVLTGDEKELHLSISDQGRGIASEHLEQIFERFYRVPGGDERLQGSGLGLTVVRAIVEAHGGRVWADSAGIGEGAVFYCALPLTPPGVQTTSWQTMGALPTVKLTRSERGAATGQAVRQSQRVRVAVVESDPRIARYLRANLEEQHYRVQVFHHGTQFLQQFDLEEPELVLLATSLTDIQGIELLQRLREFSRVPVVVLTEEDDEDERVHLLDLGADDLVGKPFSMKELLARLRVVLRRQNAAGANEAGASTFTTGELVIDYAQHQVLLAGRAIQLSRTEYKLLSTLAQNVGRVLTHELLLERVWGAEYNREVDFIWVYISRLRRKIEPDSRHPRYIVTVPDVGYKLAKIQAVAAEQT